MLRLSVSWPQCDAGGFVSGSVGRWVAGSSLGLVVRRVSGSFARRFSFPIHVVTRCDSFHSFSAIVEVQWRMTGEDWVASWLPGCVWVVSLFLLLPYKLFIRTYSCLFEFTCVYLQLSHVARVFALDNKRNQSRNWNWTWSSSGGCPGWAQKAGKDIKTLLVTWVSS